MHKSVWDDISRVWKRIAAVITATGVATTFFVNVLHLPLDKTLAISSCLGIVLLIISFYVDKQTQYIRDEMQGYLKESDDKLSLHKKESNEILLKLSEGITELKQVTSDTRKDTLRIQLLMVMERQPDNVDTILKLAETYFVKLKGDWYMTNEFNKWAKKHEVIIPKDIYSSISEHSLEED